MVLVGNRITSELFFDLKRMSSHFNTVFKMSLSLLSIRVPW